MYKKITTAAITCCVLTCSGIVAAEQKLSSETPTQAKVEASETVEGQSLLQVNSKPKQGEITMLGTISFYESWRKSLVPSKTNNGRYNQETRTQTSELFFNSQLSEDVSAFLSLYKKTNRLTSTSDDQVKEIFVNGVLPNGRWTAGKYPLYLGSTASSLYTRTLHGAQYEIDTPLRIRVFQGDVDEQDHTRAKGAMVHYGVIGSDGVTMAYVSEKNSLNNASAWYRGIDIKQYYKGNFLIDGSIVQQNSPALVADTKDITLDYRRQDDLIPANGWDFRLTATNQDRDTTKVSVVKSKRQTAALRWEMVNNVVLEMNHSQQRVANTPYKKVTTLTQTHTTDYWLRYQYNILGNRDNNMCFRVGRVLDDTSRTNGKITKEETAWQYRWDGEFRLHRYHRLTMQHEWRKSSTSVYKYNNIFRYYYDRRLGNEDKISLMAYHIRTRQFDGKTPSDVPLIGFTLNYWHYGKQVICYTLNYANYEASTNGYRRIASEIIWNF